MQTNEAGGMGSKSSAGETSASNYAAAGGVAQSWVLGCWHLVGNCRGLPLHMKQLLNTQEVQTVARKQRVLPC